MGNVNGPGARRRKTLSTSQHAKITRVDMMPSKHASEVKGLLIAILLRGITSVVPNKIELSVRYEEYRKEAGLYMYGFKRAYTNATVERSKSRKIYVWQSFGTT